MSRYVYCVMVIGHTDDGVIAYNVSSEVYENLDDAKAFVKSRSGVTVATDNDEWVAVKKVAHMPTVEFEYRIKELRIKKGKNNEK